MDEAGFWRILDAASREAEGDCARLTDLVVAQLVRLPLDEVHAFARMMDTLMDRAYSWDLWGAAFVINGGCSDDGFEYFRGWLLTQGREIFEAAMRRPESLVTIAERDVECEDVLYAPLRAIKQMTGSDEMPERYAVYPAEPVGQPWSEDELADRFPELTAAFG